MFTIHNPQLAVCFCIVTMLGWGSWANTLKLSTRRGWPFELYYWDYAVGMTLAGVFFAFTLGSHGSTGVGARESLATASTAALGAALLSGILFNISNILIVIATDLAGIAIAFPIAVGLAVVIGTSVTYWQEPAGRPLPLFVGLAFLIAAILLSAWASSQSTGATRRNSLRGALFAVLSGTVMGFFYPRLAISISDAAHSELGKMTPYAANLVFVAGLLLCNLVANSVLIRVRGESYRRYFTSGFAPHWAGIGGGVVWMTALFANLIAASVAGPAVSYALGQGATLVAALWGVFIWKEFQGATKKTSITLTAMFLSYVLGLFMIGSAAF